MYRKTKLNMFFAIKQIPAAFRFDTKDIPAANGRADAVPKIQASEDDHPVAVQHRRVVRALTGPRLGRVVHLAQH